MLAAPDLTRPNVDVARSLLGTWRRFGIVGPAYEIMAISGGSAGPDTMMRIRVLETGEELDYPLAQILDDPKER